MSQYDFTSPADQTAWDDFRKGSREAFAQLYHEHIHMLIAYGIRVTGEENVVKDAIQDLFIELWRSLAQLQPVRTVHGYLLKALRYKLMRNARVQARYSSDVPEDVDTDIESHIVEKEEELLKQVKVRRAIARLPVRQQEAINLRFYHNCSNEDIAGIMGMNYQSATNLLHRAILHLRQSMEIS
jgi:RNA polymerase sigma-70 factor (ECF subfamily)